MKIIIESAVLRMQKHLCNFHGKDGCWDWPLSINKQTGYGQLGAYKDGKHYVYSAHRLSYHAAFGPIVGDLDVCHRCDNRRCFRPDHLFLGTAKDNIRDMFKKNRQQNYEISKLKRSGDRHWSRFSPGKISRGEMKSTAKLTDEIVRAIRSSDKSTAELARIYGTSETTVQYARIGRTWKHVS
jgi:DNA-binding transcriptional regulator YiaG